MKVDDVLKELQNAKDNVDKVSESLKTIFQTGHLADNISRLRTNASILNVIADKLNKLRD